MIILNNCIDCGRVPKLQVLGSVSRNGDGSNHCYSCKCGKSVRPIDYRIWSQEVAADMWNQANPEESGFEFNREYINFLAGELASNKIKVSVREGYLLMQKPEPAFDEERCDALITECSLHSEDLTEFYRKRLEPARG